MPSRLICDLHPDMQELAKRFLQECSDQGVSAFLTCTYRSKEEQDKLYAQGRTEKGPLVTNAKGGKSAHNCVLPDGTPASLAFDIAIYNHDRSLDWSVKSQNWQKAHAIGRKIGFSLGADWKMRDNPHFEFPDWKNKSASFRQL
jgi:peptidoglycan L-alanyl-D-glutamate endopeptidase CwlK